MFSNKKQYNCELLQNISTNWSKIILLINNQKDVS